MKLPFSPTELESLSQLISQSFRDRDLQHHFSRWYGLIEDTRRGYWGCYDDFANDALSRDALEEVLQGAAVKPASLLRSLVEPLDREFVELTEPANFEAPGQPFWKSRIPKVHPDGLSDEAGFAPWRKQ
jgi:hypothetical protein